MVDKYERGYSFSGWQSTNPNRPLPAPALDNELENIERGVSDTIDGLNDIRRSDGALKNGIVTKDALAPGLSTGVDPATAWTAGAVYSANAVVFFEAVFYRCLVSHVANADFAVDLAAGRWESFADFSSYFASIEDARDEAEAAALAASGSATTASGAATTASGAATTASAAATTATGAATTASGAATTASAAATAAAASYDNFDDRYLGEKTSLPSVDNDGNALVNGALVFLTGQALSADDGMYARLDGAWTQVNGTAQPIAQKPYLASTVALTNPAAFGTWVLASGVRHGFFGQHYNGASGGYDQTGTIRVINDDGTIGATIQTINTRGLYCVTAFTIAGVRYVLLVHYAKTAGGFSYNTNSELYKYNTGTLAYDLFQTFGLDGAVRGQFFTDGTDYWLTIASSVTTGNNYSRFLYIYKWNGTVFALEDAPSTSGCYSGAVFKVSTTKYAVTCEYTDGNSGGQVRNSNFLQWNGTDYVAWNAFQGKGCSDVAVVTINGQVYAAFANQFDSITNDVSSPIYRVSNTGITPVTFVKSSFGLRVRAFTVNGRTILAYCNVARGGVGRTDYDEGRVDLYIFDGAEAKLWVSIPCKGPYDAEIWTTPAGRVFIGIANSVGGTDLSFDIAQSVKIHELPSEPVAVDITADGHETPSAYGQCRLVRVNTTTVRLDRHDGRLLTAGGRITEIPHGGITKDNAGLAANTTYRVFYAAHDGIPRLLINTTRTGFLDRSSGTYVKDDDVLWALVGRVVTDNNAQFPADANVISWFNTTLPFTP